MLRGRVAAVAKKRNNGNPNENWAKWANQKADIKPADY